MPSLPGIGIIAIKNNFSKLGKNFSWLFYLIFVVLVVFEIIEIKQSVEIVLASRQEPEVVIKDKGVRINFESYNVVVKKIEGGQSYEPPQDYVRNPFQTTISE